MTIGRRIRAARKNKGLTLQAVGDELGVSKSAVSSWEKDVFVPDNKNLIRLPRILGVGADWLLNDEESTIQEVPLLTNVSAGRLQEAQQIEPWEEFPRVTAIGLPTGRWICLRVDGNSMNRVAGDGALIFANRDETTLISGDNYVFVTDEGQASFKRYRDKPQRFEPDSTIPGYDTIFPTGPVKVIGRVGRVQTDL